MSGMDAYVTSAANAVRDASSATDKAAATRTAPKEVSLYPPRSVVQPPLSDAVIRYRAETIARAARCCSEHSLTAGTVRRDLPVIF